MRLRAWRLGGGCAAILLAVTGQSVFAQDRSPEDEAVDAIRRLTDIASQDQQRIRDWVQIQVDRLAASQKPPTPEGIDAPALKSFREKFRKQLANPANTSQFKAQLALQTAAITAGELAKPKSPPTVAAGLTQVLVDFAAPETLPGLLLALKSKTPAARYIAARGLTSQRATIAADKDKLEQVISSLRQAGLTETSGPVLSRIYEALAFQAQAGQVFDDYFAIFDKRLADRRSGALREDGAEIMAWEFFRSPPVIAALNPEQKAELVRRAAVFLRLAVERYNDPSLAVPSDATAPDTAFYERDDVERIIDALEEILQTVSGVTGGKIRDELNTNGWDGRVSVLKEAYKWIGDKEGAAKGVLNEGPWSVPAGAP